MNIQKNHLMIVFLVSLIFYPIVVNAEKIFNYQLLAVWQANTVKAKSFPLRDGDRLIDGSGFRIHVFPEKSASYRITFQSAGEKTVLWEQENLDQIILPANNKWYVLDDKRGQEKVVLEAEVLELKANPNKNLKDVLVVLEMRLHHSCTNQKI